MGVRALLTAYMRGVKSKPVLGGQFYTVGDTDPIRPRQAVGNRLLFATI